MKKSILVLATAFMFTAFFTSCRDENKGNNEMEMSDDMDDMDDMGDDLEDAADDTGDAIEKAANDVGDAVEEGVDEVKENTGTGGNDDM